MPRRKLTIEEWQDQMLRDAQRQMRRHMAQGRMERYQDELDQEAGAGLSARHQTKAVLVSMEKAPR